LSLVSHPISFIPWFGEIERKLAKLSKTTFAYRSSSELFYGWEEGNGGGGGGGGVKMVVVCGAGVTKKKNKNKI
jgi:hypothetical protein